MVYVPRLGLLALLVMVAVLAPAWGGEPPRLRVDTGPPGAAMASSNQELAEAVGRQLRGCDLLRHCRIEITTMSGTVELEGTVRDAQQGNEAVRLAQSVPGVDRVVSRLKTQEAAPANRVQPAQFGGGDPPPTLPAIADPPPPQDPLPSFRAPMPPLQPGVGQGPPPLPPYAWPTYAPYNNYSRVAYPTNYPYEAFPYIGPFYPFPKVPLGWRKVVLEFDDGFWWMSSHGQKRDFWHVKFW